MDRPGAIGGRRRFFAELLPRTARYCAELGDELHGRPHSVLDELARWPDVALRQVVPVYAQGVEAVFEAQALRLRTGREGDAEIVLPLTDSERTVLRHFGRGATLAEIAERVVAQGQACDFAQVKTLFLQLARHAVCHPAQSPLEFGHESGA